MSREITNSEAIANLNHIYGIVSPDIQRSLDLAFKALEKQPQGEWITRHKQNMLGHDVVCFECNKCGECRVPLYHLLITEPLGVCPNCGADMRVKNHKLGYKVINRGKCMLCGKELTEGLFFCKECEEKGGAELGGIKNEHRTDT